MDDHLDEIAVEQRLADAVQQDAIEGGELVPHPPELFPAEILLGLPAAEGQDAGLAERVASARGLDVERARQERLQRDRGRAHGLRERLGHRAVTTVVQALPTFGRSALDAGSQSRSTRSPRANGQYGSGAESRPSNARRPAQPPRHGHPAQAAGTSRAWLNSGASTIASRRARRSAIVSRLSGQ